MAAKAKRIIMHKDIAIRKAQQSTCRYKVSAIGIDYKGEYIGSSVNSPRFDKYGGGYHAEMKLMARYGRNLKHIFICRVGEGGDLLPIHPCSRCKTKADELGIKIITLK